VYVSYLFKYQSKLQCYTICVCESNVFYLHFWYKQTLAKLYTK